MISATLCMSLLVIVPARMDTVPNAPSPDALVYIPDEEEIAAGGGGTEYLNDLEWRSEHPFDLNRVSLDELLSLPGVSPSDAAALLAFRNVHRRFRYVQELQLVPDVGEHLFLSLGPYVQVPLRPRRSPAGSSLRLRSTRNEPGTENAPGPPYSGYARIIVSPGEGWEAAVMAEKDPGEPLRQGFAGGYIRGRFGDLEVTAGDFGVETGQGLVLWTGYFAGRTIGTPTRPGRLPRGVIPHRSTDEVRFFRGCALTWSDSVEEPSVSVTIFSSRRSLPASVDWTGSVTSLVESGTFSTDLAIAKAGAVNEIVAGARAMISPLSGVRVGGTAFLSRYDKPVRHEDPLRAHVRGWSAAGLDARYDAGLFRGFGEVARCCGGWAAIAGMSLDIGRDTDLLFLWRRYTAEFDNPHGAAFGEGGDARNETGGYAGLAWRAMKGLNIRAYADLFHRMTPTLTDPFPTDGSEGAVAVELTIRPAAVLTLDIRSRTSGSSARMIGDGGWEVDAPVRETRRQWRCSLRQNLGRRGSYRIRLAFVRAGDAQGNAHDGLVVGQEAFLRTSFGLALAAGVSLFVTDGYAARLYDLEGSLPGATFLSTLYGRGKRWFVNLSFTLSRGVTVRCAVSATENGPQLGTTAAPYDIPPSRSWRGGIQCDVALE
jgi:hypothetical protein